MVKVKPKPGSLLTIENLKTLNNNRPNNLPNTPTSVSNKSKSTNVSTTPANSPKPVRKVKSKAKSTGAINDNENRTMERKRYSRSNGDPVVPFKGAVNEQVSDAKKTIVGHCWVGEDENDQPQFMCWTKSDEEMPELVFISSNKRKLDFKNYVTIHLAKLGSFPDMNAQKKFKAAFL